MTCVYLDMARLERRLTLTSIRPLAAISYACPGLLPRGSHGMTTIPFAGRSEEHTSELQSLMRISYAVFCLKKKKTRKKIQQINNERIHKSYRKRQIEKIEQ